MRQVGLRWGRRERLQKKRAPSGRFARTARSTIATHNVIVEHALKLPALLLGHLGKSA